MLVLDFVRETSASEPSIKVPRIHAGHLGLLPGTRVYVSTPTSSSQRADMGTEVLVTPFQTTKENTALVSVVLHDAPGVVRSLVQALSWRNINIEVQESSSINHLDLHRIGMIVDLGDTFKEEETPERVQDEYRAYAANVPIHSRRYLELFDLIIAQCGDALWWHPYEEVRGSQERLIPELYIRPLYRRDELNPSSMVLQESANKRHTEIKLPTDVRDHIRQRLAIGHATEQLSYVFVSDTNDRTLRTFFLSEAFAKRLVHVGIYHPDEAGTLARMLDVIATAEFNIVTSLLRKHSKEQSVWEAVLKYEGKDGTPPAKPDDIKQLPDWYRDTLLPWIRSKLSASPRVQEIEGCGVSIGPPRYPGRYGGAKPENLLDLSTGDQRTPDPPTVRNPTVMTLLHQRYKDLQNAGRSPADEVAATRLIVTAARHRLRVDQRTLFLSYPKTAADMINNYMCSELEPPEKPSYYLTQLQNDRRPPREEAPVLPIEQSFYDLTQLREPPPGDIQQQAIALIREADYFLAIWHPEEDEDDRRCQPAKISPWMFFEYGVARTLNKPRVIACHEEIQEALGPARLVGLKKLILYNDINFAKVKVREIRDECTTMFGDNHEALFNDDRSDETSTTEL